MGGKSGGGFEASRYLLSIHIGLCARVDQVLAAYYGEKEYWSGIVENNQSIPVSNTGLFGGDKKEGGVEGTMHVLLGKTDQVLPDALAQKLGRANGADAPGFRGVTSIFHTGPSAGLAGWLWCANSPYLKTLWYKVKRIPESLAVAFARVGNEDANPAHIIYDVLVNTEYGLGLDGSAAVDNASFFSAAQTLYNEGLGLSMAWSTTTEAQDFIDEVKNHINAVVFPDPETGKIVLKLIRDDYNEATLRSVNPDNANMTKFSRKAWGDTINEIVVTWTDPKNEQDATVTLQDNGNIAEQGEVISDAKNYYGVRTADLAWKLAARDLRVASAPLCSAELELNREFWNIKPGDCIKVTWPDYGMVDLVMRVWEVKYGSGRRGSSTVVVSLTEDIFALPVSAFVKPPTTEWVDPSRSPEPVTVYKIMTPPLYMAAQVAGVAANSFQYPVAYAAILAAAPNPDTASFDLLGQGRDAANNVVWQARGTKSITGHGALLAVLPAEATSNVASFNVDSGNGPGQAVFMVIGNGTEAAMEMALIQTQTGGNWVIKRGILDTVPREWPVGTPVWFLRSDFLVADETAQSAGSNPAYKLLTNTSKGQLSQTAAPTFTGALTDRMHLPLRPANLKVNGEGFADVAPPASGDVTVTWVRRNRLTEEQIVLGWTDADVTPEAGQTTTVTVSNAANGAVLATYPGETGTSRALNVITAAGSSGATEVYIAASAVRDGLTSLQSHRIKVVVPTVTGGYGQNYGASYG